MDFILSAGPHLIKPTHVTVGDRWRRQHLTSSCRMNHCLEGQLFNLKPVQLVVQSCF